MKFARSLGSITKFQILGAYWLLSSCSYEESSIRSSIPTGINIGRLIAKADCGDLFSFQGAAAFALFPETAAMMQKRGLSFFDDIAAANNKAQTRYYDPGKWQPTPVKYMPGDRSSFNISCAIEHGSNWPPSIGNDLNRSGGFYTTGGSGRMLVVFPRRGYVVAVISDK